MERSAEDLMNEARFLWVQAHRIGTDGHGRGVDDTLANRAIALARRATRKQVKRRMNDEPEETGT